MSAAELVFEEPPLYVDGQGGGVCSTDELPRVAEECGGVLVVVDLEKAA